MKLIKKNNLTEQGRKQQSKGDFSNAIATYKRAITNNPKDINAYLNLGLCYASINNNAEAAKIFHEIHIKFPDNDDIWLLSGKTYLKNGQYDIASNFFKKYVQKHPKNYESWVNLSVCSLGSNNLTPAIYYATEALSIEPTNPTSYLNLGSALFAFRKFKDAKECYETVLELDPENLQAKANIGNILYETHEYKAAIEIYEQCLHSIKPDSDSYHDIAYRLSYPLLTIGDLERGWQCYESGLKLHDKRARHPQRKFDIPQWEGQKIINESLLVWREQGIGDEFRFLSLLPSILEKCGKVIIECSPRLVTLLTRSFPTCQVRTESITMPGFKSDYHDFDYHLPMASLCKLYFNNFDIYEPPAPYIKPLAEKVELFKERLKPFINKKIVGICWRSGFINSERNANYTTISEWEPILKNDNFVFVNLQYGDCSVEIEGVKKHFGIDIISWPDIDLMNDLESVSAIIEATDLVITVGTAVHSMAEAIGKPVFLMAHNGWINLGQDIWPWAKNVRIFSPTDMLTPMSTIIPSVALALENFESGLD